MDGSFGSAEAVVGCFEPLLIAELKLSQQQLLRLTASCVIDVCCCEQCALGSSVPSGSSLKVFSHKLGVWAPPPAAVTAIAREMCDRDVLLRTMRFGRRGIL